MGKTPKHQGHKSSRPYNARNELVHKSVSGNKKLTQESHRSASADYVARKISTNHGSQHLRLRNQSYLFGVSKGYQDTTKVRSLKIKHTSREQSRGLADKKRAVHSQGVQKQTMQQQDTPQSSQPTEQTENGETYKKEDERSITNPSAELKDLCEESTNSLIPTEESNDLENNTEEHVSPKTKNQKQSVKGKSQSKQRKEVTDDVKDELPPINETAELSSTEESLHPTSEIIQEKNVQADPHSKEDSESKQESIDEPNELFTDQHTECNDNLLPEEVSLGNKTLRISLIPVDDAPISFIGTTHKENGEVDDSGEMGKLSLSCSSSELSLSSAETEQFEVDPTLPEVEPSNFRILSDPSQSFANSLRSISGRRPMRGSAVGLDRIGFTLRKSSVLDENEYSKKNTVSRELSCGMSDIFEPHLERNVNSVKRKAVEVGVSIEAKKAKLDTSHTYGFFSIMSSPLQILRSKMKNERVMAATEAENEHDCINKDDLLKTVNTDIKDKHGSALSSDSTENTKLDKSWCNIM